LQKKKAFFKKRVQKNTHITRYDRQSIVQHLAQTKKKLKRNFRTNEEFEIAKYDKFRILLTGKLQRKL